MIRLRKTPAAACVTLCALVWAATVSAQENATGDEWINIRLTQPDAAGPPTEATAAIPYEIAKIVIGAVPAKYRKEAKEAGFDLAVLHRLADELKPGKELKINSEEMNLVVGKELRETGQRKAATFVRLKVETT